MATLTAPQLGADPPPRPDGHSYTPEDCDVQPPPPAADDPLAGLRSRMRARLYDRDRLDTIEPPTAIIDGVLDVGTVGLLSGKFGTYKTFVVVSWACCVANGLAWEGREVVTPGPVLFVAGEGSSGLRSRIRAWEIQFNAAERIAADRLIVYDGRMKITDQDEMIILAEFIEELRPALIIYDTLHKCAPGMEENSSRDMGVVLDVLYGLREDYGVTSLLNHHTGHTGDRSRGSSSLEDDVDTSWLIRLNDPEDRSADNQRTLVHRKSKEGETLAEMDLVLRLVPEIQSGYVEVGSVASSLFLPEGQAAMHVIKILDDLGVADNAGRPHAGLVLKNAGMKFDTNVLAEAIRRRRMRGFVTP